MCKIRHRDDNGDAQGDWSKTENYLTVNKPQTNNNDNKKEEKNKVNNDIEHKMMIT